MIYYKTIKIEGKDYICKYKVTYNIQKLKEIRKKLINECSEIHHYEFKTIDSNFYLEGDNIIGFQKHKIGMKKIGKDIPILPEYQVSYDELAFPIEALYIDSVLRGHSASLSELLDRITSFQSSPIIDNRFVQALNSINTSINQTEEGMKKGTITQERGLSCLKILNKQREAVELEIALNKHQKQPFIYYKELLKSFTFTRIATLSIEDFQSFLNFFAVEEPLNDKSYDNVTRITRILNKTKNK